MSPTHRAIACHLSAAMVHVSTGIVLAGLIKGDGHLVLHGAGFAAGWYLMFSWMKKERTDG